MIFDWTQILPALGRRRGVKGRVTGDELVADGIAIVRQAFRRARWRFSLNRFGAGNPRFLLQRSNFVPQQAHRFSGRQKNAGSRIFRAFNASRPCNTCALSYQKNSI